MSFNIRQRETSYCWIRSQAFHEVYLFEKLSWKSPGPQNKTFIREASTGTSYKLRDKKRHRLAKMEYYYSGTESLWCVNWNHLVCRRWKCEVDHHSQLTVVNLGKKQKLCSLRCLWSKVQQDTYCTDNFRILCRLWTINHQCTCKWDWTEMLNVSFPFFLFLFPLPFWEFLSLWEQRLHEVRFVWIQKDVDEKRGTIHTHWNADCLLGDFSGKTTTILPTRNSSILMMSSSEYLFLESECSFTKYVSSCPNIKYLYLRLPFLKMKAFRIKLVSLSFNFWWDMVI